MIKLSKSDLITIVEIARLCCGYAPEDICEDLDISDEEFIRIRNVINLLGCNNYISLHGCNITHYVARLAR
jgi:hypothetical protein